MRKSMKHRVIRQPARWGGLDVMRRRTHFVQIAHAGGHVSARCPCGWEGTSYPISPLARIIDIDQGSAVWAAEQEARSHERKSPAQHRHAHADRSQ